MTVHDETTRGAWRVDDDGCVRTRDGRGVVTAFDHRVIATDADLRAVAAVPELLDLANAVIVGQPMPTLLRLAHVADAKARGEIA
jgi:hypothetical protein